MSGLVVGLITAVAALVGCTDTHSDSGSAVTSVDTGSLEHVWSITASTGLGDYPDLSAHLTFSNATSDHAKLVIDGCANATSDIQLQPGNKLTVAPQGRWGICASPFDIGQAIPEFFKGPVSWTVVGKQLTLTSRDGASITLTAKD